MHVQTRKNDKHTPHHAPDFLDRLSIVFAAAGIRPREYVSQIMKATSLSKSGARLVIESQRPPKRLEVFEKLVVFLVAELKNHQHDISKDRLTEYLLSGTNNPFGEENNEFPLSKFLEEDPVLTSQLILEIEKVAKETSIDSDSPLQRDKIDLIYYRIISYAFKNNMKPQSEKLKKNIISLLTLARNNLL